MKKEIIKSLMENFESHSHKTENGVEFWLARDLQKLLGYTQWRNFIFVVDKAKISCASTGCNVEHHFADVSKMINLAKGANRDVPDIIFTRYACYLIAQNGDPRKDEIAFAQNYFAVQTRRFENLEKRISDSERVLARHKLTETEKELSGVIFRQTGSDKNFGLIRSNGDKALFGFTTNEMKYRLKIPERRALADFQPTIILKAKDFATEITIFNIKVKSLMSEGQISVEHIANNKRVRKTLIERGIKPELLPKEDDIKKVERKIKDDDKKSLNKPDGLA